MRPSFFQLNYSAILILDFGFAILDYCEISFEINSQGHMQSKIEVADIGFEPTTCGLEDRRSDVQLS